MSFESLKNYCLSKLGAFEDYPFGPSPLVIKVSSKMFALISETDDRLSISLKCDPFLAENLRQQYPSVIAGYHLNKRHWNTVYINDSIPESEIYWMIDHSYEIIVKSLTKAQKVELEKYSIQSSTHT